LTVADTGIGMDERTVSRMFEPFFTTKPKGEGTGLGLAAVHGIVTGQEGAIAVRSAPGKGTRVDVYLPSGRGQIVDAVETGEPAPGGGERLLLVDDEPDLVEIGRKSLERLGYQVDAMTSSTAALKAFEAAPDRWSLVITDHVMPALSGETMARSMLHLRPDLPIVMCTGYGEAISADVARAAGIREFVLKPMVGRDLGRMVRRLLDEVAQAVTTS
jgi:CheY-like chemotaxis protein